MPLERKPFSVYPRKGKIYYAQFRNPDGSWGTAKSTGQASRSKAEAWCINYLQAGGIVQRENVTFAEFAKDFFSWDGEYSRDRQITGKRISQRQCKEKIFYISATRLTGKCKQFPTSQKSMKTWQ